MKFCMAVKVVYVNTELLHCLEKFCFLQQIITTAYFALFTAEIVVHNLHCTVNVHC